MRDKKRRSTTEAKVGLMVFEDGGRDDKPRNEGCL